MPERNRRHTEWLWYIAGETMGGGRPAPSPRDAPLGLPDRRLRTVFLTTIALVSVLHLTTVPPIIPWGPPGSYGDNGAGNLLS